MRYLGLLIMASACTGAGFLAAESWRERLEILKLLRQMAYHLKGRILYANETLPEALFEVGERFSKDRTGMCLEPGRLFLRVRKRMEKTQLSNLTDEIVIDSRDEDIRALTTAYQNLMFRLDHSLNLEKKLNLLQLQAQFDTLQAQINPHFLYNVLNVISSRGMKDNDEVICEICGRLADMLRYSTNTKTRYASIEEEVTYTEQYLYLIKVRYADKISLDTEVDGGIRAQIVPKTVLQQIVENSINHGFENNTGRMEITLRGFQKDGYWFLSVRDNGQGFREETLKDLNEKFEKTKKSLFEDRSNIELEIGGMGLVNTYARLLLIYSDSLVFELKNTEDGSEVLFGAKMS